MESCAKENQRYKQKLTKLAADQKEAEELQEHARQGIRAPQLAEATDAAALANCPRAMETEVVDAETAQLFAEWSDAATPDWSSVPWDRAMVGRLTPLATREQDTLELLDSTCMDDLERLRVGASTLIDTCLEHDLRPNLGLGKTEALVHLRSTGAKHAKHQFFVDGGGSLSLCCRLWPGAGCALHRLINTLEAPCTTRAVSSPGQHRLGLLSICTRSKCLLPPRSAGKTRRSSLTASLPLLSSMVRTFGLSSLTRAFND